MGISHLAQSGMTDILGIMVWGDGSGDGGAGTGGDEGSGWGGGEVSGGVLVVKAPIALQALLVLEPVALTFQK